MNNSSIKIFDRHAVRRHRERAADGFGSFSFLFRETAERLVDRLFDIRREFPLTLDLGSQGGLVADILAGRDSIESIVQCGLSEKLVRGASGLRSSGMRKFSHLHPLPLTW